MPWMEASAGITIGLLTAAAVIFWLSRTPRRPDYRIRKGDQGLNFLFENGTLVDASDEAEALLNETGEGSDWSSITRLFQSRFAFPDDELAPPDSDGVDYYPARDGADGGLIGVSKSGKCVRVDLLGRDDTPGAGSHKLHLLNQELETLRNASRVAPIPIWLVSEGSEVRWYNAAYDRLYREVYKQPPQPGLPLFRLPEPKLEQGKTRRLPVTPPNTRSSVWYDVQRIETPMGDFYTAVDANAIVRAEAAQRNFVQTLAKTFAHLPIGLAIFDDNRQLVLFNPAVIDLTGLGADFLSSRPNLLSFFDELRNRRLMPEPKNYNSWRQQIADLVAAAADGRYSETWTLDSGRTYRVNGRPHPDGAIAFLIEDISAEVALTRRFRAELELGQSVLDSLPSAIAVYSSNGVLTMSNAAYREMWAVDPESTFANMTIIDCLRTWQEKSRPSPVWGEVRDFVLDFGDKSEWTAQVELTSGEVMEIAAVPMASNATMIRFSRPDLDRFDSPAPAPLET